MGRRVQALLMSWSAALVLFGLLACQADDQGFSRTESVVGETSDTFYNCQTATTLRSQNVVFAVSRINNTLREVVVSAENLGLPPQRLSKQGNQLWSNGDLSLRLGLKANGGKSIQVHYSSLGVTAAFANGFCTVVCGERTQKVGNNCFSTGVADYDGTVDLAVEALGTLGVGVLRQAFLHLARGVVKAGGTVAPRAFHAAAQADVVSTQVNLLHVAQQANPLRLPQYSHLSRGLRGIGCDCVNNCSACVVAVEATLRGHPAVALPFRASQSSQYLSDLFGGTWSQVVNYRALVDNMAEGMRYIVLVYGGESGQAHLLNLVRQNGRSWFVDGQSGVVLNPKVYLEVMKAQGHKQMRVLRTN